MALSKKLLGGVVYKDTPSKQVQGQVSNGGIYFAEQAKQAAKLNKNIEAMLAATSDCANTRACFSAGTGILIDSNGVISLSDTIDNVTTGGSFDVSTGMLTLFDNDPSTPDVTFTLNIPGLINNEFDHIANGNPTSLTNFCPAVNKCIGDNGLPVGTDLFILDGDQIQSGDNITTTNVLNIVGTTLTSTVNGVASNVLLKAGTTSYDNAASGLTATNVQSALDEIDGDVDTNTTNIATNTTNISTLQGVSHVAMTANDSNTIDFTTSGTDNQTLTANVILNTSADNILQTGANGLYVKDLAIETTSQAMLGYNAATRELSVKQLLITDVTVDNASADLSTWVTNSGYTGTEVQEGDIIILNAAGESWIHNGGTAGTSADFEKIESPVQASAIHAMFSGTDPIVYNAATGNISLKYSTDADNKAANGTDGGLYVDEKATATTYDNATSGAAATNVQTAIDELFAGGAALDPALYENDLAVVGGKLGVGAPLVKNTITALSGFTRSRDGTLGQRVRIGDGNLEVTTRFFGTNYNAKLSGASLTFDKPSKSVIQANSPGGFLSFVTTDTSGDEQQMLLDSRGSLFLTEDVIASITPNTPSGDYAKFYSKDGAVVIENKKTDGDELLWLNASTPVRFEEGINTIDSLPGISSGVTLKAKSYGVSALDGTTLLGFYGDGTDKRVFSNTSFGMSIREISADYTIQDSDNTLIVDTTAGNIIVNIPLTYMGRIITIKKVTSDNNTVTILPPGGTDIEGNPQYIITNAFDAIKTQRSTSGNRWII